MPRTNFFATFLFSAAFAALGRASPQPLPVMPAPAAVHTGSGRLPVTGSTLQAVWMALPDARLRAAFGRAQARWHSRIGTEGPAAGTRLYIDCHEPGGALPALGDDESYDLEISEEKAELRAPNALGVMHGLETLLQLLQKDSSGWYLPAAAISDHPRFAWRGLMIDVARHWQPAEVIERNLDAMAVVKLNVLHLHLTDDQGFRIESRTHPELQGKGSDGLFFTQEQMRGIIAYAAARGIRVVPEFDVPGHATSWVVSHPELASLPGPYEIERHWGVFNPVLDPTNEGTYALLGDFLGEMASLFPDRFVHIGGDENNGVQWSANPRIQAFIRDHGLKDNGGLHAYFNQRIVAILAKSGKRLVGWDEILHPGLPLDCVIDSWRGSEALASAAVQGYDCILSNGYYIDLIYPAADHYLADPIPPDSTLSPAQRKHVLGGEATMWAEWVTPETIDSRIWPRTAAIAERFWSPADVRDVADMYRRLALVSERLSEAGALHLANRDRMLRHLVGDDLGQPGVDSLRTFIALLEPVKHYDRGGLQPQVDQRVPLVFLADAALPDSAPSRAFADAVDQTLFGSGAIDRAEAETLSRQLEHWRLVATDVIRLGGEHAALKEALQPAANLQAACEVGEQALASLASGKPLDAEHMTADLAKIDQAARPNGSATELPILRPIRRLAVAASLQGERPGFSSNAWRQRVDAAAFAPQPESAAK